MEKDQDKLRSMLNQYGVVRLREQHMRQPSTVSESQVLTSTPLDHTEPETSPELSFSKKPSVNVKVVAEERSSSSSSGTAAETM